VTPEQLARIHAAAFTLDRSWTAQEFADLLASPFTKLFTVPFGFALTRLIAGEAELLTIAVDPAHQNRGAGRVLLETWLRALAGKAESAFLEVASDNAPAFRLYQQAGFAVTAKRARYYLRKDAAAVDALIMTRDVTLGHPAVSGH
jgi:[ribosomal protein S18]-alanine N-acetyltransferase